MKIGLISDTHAPSMGRVPPIEVARAFAGVDLILHAGDIYTSECLDWLEQIAPVLGVEIYPAPVQGDARVVEKRVMQLEGHSVGLIHDLQFQSIGADIRAGVLGMPQFADRNIPALAEQVFDRPVSVVIHGHTHASMAEVHQGVLIVNPGSPTLPFMRRQLGQVAIMEFSAGAGWSAHIVDLKTYTNE